MREIVGWLTPEVGAAMRNLIWKTKPDVCVEIGVFAGKSLINTALALKENGHGVVCGIDPWRKETALEALTPDDAAPEWWASIDLDAVHYDCMRAIWQHGLEEYAVVIRTESRNARFLFGKGREAGWTEPYRCIDILYVDGGHTEEASCLDVSMYGQKVKTGGHIWLDDTNYESLKPAIELVERQCVLVKDFGHCRLYKKL